MFRHIYIHGNIQRNGSGLLPCWRNPLEQNYYPPLMFQFSPKVIHLVYDSHNMARALARKICLTFPRTGPLASVPCATYQSRHNACERTQPKQNLDPTSFGNPHSHNPAYCINFFPLVHQRSRTRLGLGPNNPSLPLNVLYKSFIRVPVHLKSIGSRLPRCLTVKIYHGLWK